MPRSLVISLPRVMADALERLMDALHVWQSPALRKSIRVVGKFQVDFDGKGDIVPT